MGRRGEEEKVVVNHISCLSAWVNDVSQNAKLWEEEQVWTRGLTEWGEMEQPIKRYCTQLQHDPSQKIRKS